MEIFILRIIARNAKARINKGEKKKVVIDSYTKLSDTDKKAVEDLVTSLPE